ncbi:MAG: glutamate 5-kinase [Verrucomicrobiota bacterium]
MVPLAQAKRVVIKIGTGVLTSGIGELDTARIEALCQQVVTLRECRIEVVLVSSGAIGLGMGTLGLEKRPKDLASLQACAAVGQSILINTWQKCFDAHGITVAQILLTREDLRAKHRHNAIFKTTERLLSSGVVPIVNENDSVSAAEIKFGDNDTLSALVSSVINADLLFILSNIPGLVDLEGTGEVITRVEKITPEIEALAKGTQQATSVGGMVSKLSAAKIAQRAGCGVVIGSGKDAALFEKLLNGETAGSYFVPNERPVKPHKRWIAIQDNAQGMLKVDDGATEALLKGGKSLLSGGIVEFTGDFEEFDVVEICSLSGDVIALGQVIQGSAELDTILRDINKDIPANLVIHRDNLVILN